MTEISNSCKAPMSVQEPPASVDRERIKLRLDELWSQMARDDEPVNPHILDVRRMIHSQDYDGARRVLRKCFAPDAEMNNLCGVLYELEGEFEKARQDYRAALKRDRSLGAAELNLRRYYELWTFGRSEIPICL